MVPPRQFAIRPATEKDVDALRACLQAAFAAYQDRYTPEAFRDTVPDTAGWLERFGVMHVLVASSGESVTGTVSGMASGTGEGHLRGMAVLPGWQGTGVADRLLAEIEAHLKRQGCTRITLDTTEPLERAMRFYERHGYSRSGRISDFFGMRLLEYHKYLTE